MERKETQREKFERLAGLNEQFDYSREELDSVSAQEVASSKIPVKGDKLRRELYKVVTPLTHGLYKDDNWFGVKKVQEAINSVCAKYNAHAIFYAGTYENMGQHNPFKKWPVTIEYMDHKGVDSEMQGNVIAHGAGSVQDPLDRYDITFVI